MSGLCQCEHSAPRREGPGVMGAAWFCYNCGRILPTRGFVIKEEAPPPVADDVDPYKEKEQ